MENPDSERRVPRSAQLAQLMKQSADLVTRSDAILKSSKLLRDKSLRLKGKGSRQRNAPGK